MQNKDKVGNEMVPDGEENINELVSKEKCIQLIKQLQEKRELRYANLNSQPLGETQLKKLDSSIKKNTAFVKKLKSLTEESKKSCLDEINKLNLSRYVSEVVVSVVESVQRAKDVWAVVEVCSCMVQKYADFKLALVPALIAAFKGSVASTDSIAEEDSAISRQMLNRRRALLRVFCELLLVGITDDHKNILEILNGLVNVDYENVEAAQSSTSLLAVFVKAHREEFLGFRNSYADAATLDSNDSEIQTQFKQELDKQFCLPKEIQEEYLKVCQGGYEKTCAALTRRHQHLKKLEEDNARTMTTRGDLPEEAYEAYAAVRKNFDALHRVVLQLAEGLEASMPQFPDNLVTRMDGSSSVSVHTQNQDDAKSQLLFDEPETASFYESLPDIPSLVPQVLLQGGAGGAQTEQNEDSKTETVEAEQGPAEDIGDEEQEILESEKQDTVAIEDPMEALIKKMPNCVTKEQCDEISLGFCFINSKGNRKKMIRALCQLPKGCLQLLPYYARITASLSSVFPDVIAGVLGHLEQEFNKLQAKKDGTRLTLEPRIRNIKYLGELCKFKCVQYGIVFTTLKTLLDDFGGHNVDTACALVDAAGRFLIRLPETNARMDNMIQVMVRLKNVKNLDHRQSALVEGAYFECKPPSETNVRRKRRSSYQEFVRHLLYKKLSHDTIEDVSKKLRKLNWEEMESYILRKCLKIVQAKFQSIPWIAQLVALLRKYHSSLSVALVDGLLEEIRVGLEGGFQYLLQLRVSHMKLLGELYNYRCVDSTTVFETLYLILFFGYHDQSLASKLDPPDNYFRVRLVTALLETCGTYFDRGSSKDKLDRFLLYLQRYILSKDDLPLDMDFVIQDLFQLLRPGMQRFDNLEEACKAVEEMEEATQNQEVEEYDEDDESSGDSEEEVEQRQHIKERETDEIELEMDYDDNDEQHDVSEEVLRLKRSRKQEVDEAFEREYAAVMLESRKLSGDAARDKKNQDKQQDTVGFKMLIKKAGKTVNSKEVQIPRAATLASTLLEHERHEAEERSEIKKLVLAANQREEEQEQKSKYRPVYKVHQSSSMKYTRL